MGIFLQIFLLVDVFFMGVIAATALRHAYAHFRPHEPEPEKRHAAAPAPQSVHLSPEVRDQLLASAQANFQRVLAHAAMQLQRDLGATETRLSHKLERLGNEIVSKEMERYHAELDKLRTQAETVTKDGAVELGKHQAELRAQLDEQLAAEKEKLLTQLDTKLADAVSSFLLETMQHNVDLGAQTSYLTKMLEEHKEELKKELIA